MSEFSGKTIWITGASSGIGEALAIAFSRLGAVIILSSRNEEQLAAVKSQLSLPEKHLILPMDLMDQSNFSELTGQAISHTGQVDILVNNGGISQRSLAMETDLSVDRKIMEVDYFGAIALTKIILPHMVERGSGSVVSISSVAGKVGNKRRTAYCAAKHALLGFMNALRAELHGSGVNVCVISPGFVKTNISKNAMTGDAKAFGKMESSIQNGIPVDKFAGIVIKAIEKNKAEVIVAEGVALFAYHLYRFFPNLYHRLIGPMDPP